MLSHNILAIGVAMTVAFAKDYYEARTGHRLISGEVLAAADRAMALTAVVLDVVPLVGPSFRALASASDCLEIFTDMMKSAKAEGSVASASAAEVAELSDAIQGAERVLESAKDAIHAMGPKKFAEILEIPKGTRPLPESYLPKDYIEKHLAEFDDGASRFMRKSDLERYGPAQVDGTSFVLPKNEADKILSSAAGDRKVLEESLGLPSGYLDNVEMVRVDVSKPRDLNLRIPSGNETGVNPQWLPGGKLPNGNTEAVIDIGKAPADSWNSSPMTLK